MDKAKRPVVRRVGKERSQKEWSEKRKEWVGCFEMAQESQRAGEKAAEDSNIKLGRRMSVELACFDT